MKHIVLIAILTVLALSFSIGAQQPDKPTAQTVTKPVPTPEPTPLPPLMLTAEQFQRLALAETQLQAAQQAADAAKARLDALMLQLFLEKGGTLADYDLRVQQVGGQALGFLPRAKAK